MSSNIYLIPVSEIKDSTYVDDNVSDKMIKISILDAQEQILEPILGTLLYEKLLTGTLNKDLTTPYQILLVDYIWKVLLQATVFKLVHNLLLRITNSSVVKDSNENSTAISIQELNVLKSERELSLNYHSKKLKKYLQAYSSTFPEYLGSQPTEGDNPDLGDDNMDFWDYDFGNNGGPSTRG